MNHILINRLDALPHDILLIIIRKCAKQDYVALYLAYPRLSRRLYAIIPQGLSIRFVSRDNGGIFTSKYECVLSCPFMSTNEQWHGCIYYDKYKNKIVLSNNPINATNGCGDVNGIDISLQYDPQLYLHLKKSKRESLGSILGGCDSYDDCPDCIEGTKRWENEVFYYAYGSDIDD